MKIVFLGDIIFEGDEEATKNKYEEIRLEFKKHLERLKIELPNSYPKRSTDTYNQHLENLRTLSPTVYEDLSYIKDFFGEKFFEFRFNETMNFVTTKVVTNIPVEHHFLGRVLIGKKGYNLIDLYMEFVMGEKFKNSIISLEE